MRSSLLRAATLAPAVIVGGLAMGSTPGWAAAPQVLAVIATAEPMQLRCDHRDCSAEFTSYCLQKARRSPEKGTPYFLHDTQSVSLEGITADGRTVRLPLDELQIESERYHAAVRMRVPRDFLATYQIASLQISIAEKATLIPEPVAGERSPISEDEIAMATGPLRDVGAAIVEAGDERLGAARTTSLVINALPRTGRADEATRQSVWADAAPRPDAPGYDLAQKGFQRCQSITIAGMMSLRQCLGSLHDAFVSKLNKEYWKAVDFGS